MTTEDGAWQARQCVCVPGHSEVEAFANSVPGICAKCPPDSYNDRHNASCVGCPEHSSHAETAQTLLTACTCDPGYTGSDGGPCAACADGKFKTYNGSAPCEACPENTYSDGEAALRCTACPWNSTAPPQSAHIVECLCDPGFERIGDECRQCGAGKFKGGSGNEPCALCEAETEYVDTEGATACLACDDNSHSTPTRELCLCDAGYYQTDHGLSRPQCTACPPNSYQNVTGQTGCVSCHVNAQSSAASLSLDACVCNRGYIDEDFGSCTACATGTYKDVVDDTVLACTDCPSSADSPPASPDLSSCSCNAGFEGELGGPCVACEPGFYKPGQSTTGEEVCTKCPANTYADQESATACLQCFGHSLSAEGSDDLADCLCDTATGYVEVAEDGERACSACTSGKYATSDDSDTGASCTNCSYGTFTNTSGKTVCDICPLNTSTYSYPQTECECDAGYRCDPQEVAECLRQSDINFLNANPLIASSLFRVRVVCTVNVSYTNMLIKNVPPGQYYGRTYLANMITNRTGGYLGFRHIIGDWNGGQPSHDYASQYWIHDYTRMHWKETRSNIVQINSALSGSMYYLTPAKFVMLGMRFRVLDNPLLHTANAMQTIFCWNYWPSFYVFLVRAMLVNNELKIDMLSYGGTHFFTSFDTWISIFAQIYNGKVFVKVQFEDGTPDQRFEFMFNSAAGDPVYDGAHNGEFSISLGNVASDGQLRGTEGKAMWQKNTATFDASHLFIDYACTDTALLDTITFKKECKQPSGGGRDCNKCDGDCEACEADTFKPSSGYASSCTPCQANAQSPSASTDPSHCLCNAGFFHEQEYTSPPPYTCASCAAGSYTDAVGTYGCTTCPTNYFTPVERHPWDEAADCVACGLCPEHEYDAARGGLGCGLDVPTDCQACPANSGTSHNDTFEGRNTDVTSCACNAGYYGPLGGPCQLCPAGHVKTERLDRDTYIDDCIECPANTYEGSRALPCYNCLAHSSSSPGSSEKQHCLCDAGRENADDDIVQFLTLYMGDGIPLPLALEALATTELSPDFQGAFDDDGWTVCRRCARGRFKSLPGAQACQECPPDSYQNVSGQLQCDACPHNMSSLAAATECFCDPSFENVDGEHHDCTLCQEATYKTDFGNQGCTTCDVCLANEQVDVECAPGHNISCKACQAASWSPAGRSERGPCLCNAGYELTYGEGFADGYTCVACQAGQFRTTDTNNSVGCRTCGALTYTTESATVTCLPCTGVCDDTLDTSTHAFYVSAECTPSTDIVCTQCRVCPAGSYANRTCGSAFNNDRSDTTCDVCPAGFYCAGNGTAPQVCPLHSTSVAGVSSAASCGCNAGYYQTDVHLYGADVGAPIYDGLGLPSHQCFPCSADTYCEGDGTVRQCPAHSFTRSTESSVRLDCHCFPGYYRTGEQDTFEVAFECTLCTPNDYCFNNTRFNCTDERMLSDVGSAYFSNCTCMSGFYNNDTRCEPCGVDSYCVDGRAFECPAHEWTSGEMQYSECYCRPGYYSPTMPLSSPKNCELCPRDSFCPGEYDLRINCTAHSTSPPGSSKDVHCLCLPGYGNATLYAILPNDTPTFHACEACGDGFVKEATDNSACSACTVCAPQYGTYEIQACRADHDARCDSCDPCTNGSIWTSQACSEKLNAICSPCTVCDYAKEYLDETCTSLQNAVCRNITFGRSCPVGQYAGGHTDRTDSYCMPCVYRDTEYMSQHLHEAASAGTRYDDAYSCEIRCLGLSRMADPSNHSLGCVSCETGNVLLREFAVVRDTSDRHIRCEFSCRKGFEYDANRNDCFAPQLQASRSNSFYHALHLTNWERSSQGFLFSVAHTNHSRFVVVVGPTPPTSCRLDECCFRNLWRVSSVEQMGLPPGAAEACSRQPPLSHHATYSDTLEFEVPDSRMPEVATCRYVGNATQECTLVLSMVDTVLQRSISQTVVIYTRRATTYAFLNGAHQYIPMQDFTVDVLLASADPTTGVRIFLVLTQVRSTHGEQNVTLRVPGMTPTSAPCALLTLQNNTEFPPTPSVMAPEGASVAFATYWRGHGDFDVIRLYYSLRGSADDVMDVAAVRNVTLLSPACVPHAHASTIQLGTVDAASGMGEDVIAGMHRLHQASQPTHTTRGELGSLITFMVSALTPTVTDFSVKSVLAAHFRGLIPEQVLANSTARTNGILDFTYPFRVWCREHSSSCSYEYLHLDARGRSMFIIKSCDETTRNEARSWLHAYFGVVSDDGHVDALCARLASARHKAFAVLVNTLAYLPKSSFWNAYHNSTQQPTSTLAWPDFLLV